MNQDIWRVTQILTAESPASAMKLRAEVRAVPGKGLDGDRYFSSTGTFSPTRPSPDFEITFIEQEQIEAFARESRVPFTSLHARRNIVTEGVRVNSLVGIEFYVGKVRIRGIRLCEPCNHLAKISFPETLEGLVHKGGLRAQVLSEGLIRVGDAIRVIA
ncbi:MAG: MOSC domain-containing protein [Pedosphaera sp.]|nr:MOSC domain-containing protein [Pedosphaera sp.]